MDSTQTQKNINTYFEWKVILFYIPFFKESFVVEVTFKWIYIYIYIYIFIYILYIYVYIYYIYMMYNNIHDGYTYTKTWKEQWTVKKYKVSHSVGQGDRGVGGTSPTHPTIVFENPPIKTDALAMGCIPLPI